MARCWDCRLPDPYNGQCDGIGSCECPRCEWCGGPPLVCDCNGDDYPCPDDVFLPPVVTVEIPGVS